MSEPSTDEPRIVLITGGSRGIGRSFTKAVVNSILLIVVVDRLLRRLLRHRKQRQLLRRRIAP